MKEKHTYSIGLIVGKACKLLMLMVVKPALAFVKVICVITWAAMCMAFKRMVVLGVILSVIVVIMSIIVLNNLQLIKF